MTTYLVKAAGVESEADAASIGVYANLPNVYRITDILIFGSHSFFFELLRDDYFFNLSLHYFISL